MSPEILSCLERFTAGRTCERSVSRMNPLVKTHCRRVLEAFAAVSTLALVQIAVSVEIVLLEVYTQLKPDLTFLATVRTLLPTAAQNHRYSR